MQIPDGLPPSVDKPLRKAKTDSEFKSQCRRLIRKGVDSQTLSKLQGLLEAPNEVAGSLQE